MERSLAGDEDVRNMPPRKTGAGAPEAVAFGKRVRALRLKRGWTQERLAEEAELNSVQVSHIERGRNDPKLTTVLRLASAFRITAGELLRLLK
jgi:transcriptional regulator with XRE-family HTH domain